MGRTTCMQILKKAYLELHKNMGDTMIQHAFTSQTKNYLKKHQVLSDSPISHLGNPSLSLDISFNTSTSSGPRIVIVGAGLAGLTCAYRLKQAGYKAEIYEASERVGGRCHTRRGDFADNQIVERGGEFIDQGQVAIQ
ncbi:NAD(P)-binding protein, partial [Bacillus toyonensis]|uniref:FAD-dependent oxidoreductase n=1 Tax=Bacillus toyonensis TaxID=155322 RepID=UPI003464E92C